MHLHKENDVYFFSDTVHLLHTVKLASSARSNSQKNVKKLALRMIKCVFHKEKLDPSSNQSKQYRL